MPRNCTLCGKPIILVPSAKKRAERWGGKASDYEALFTTHSLCAIEKRKQDTLELMRSQK